MVFILGGRVDSVVNTDTVYRNTSALKKPEVRVKPLAKKNQKIAKNKKKQNKIQ